MDEGQIRKKYNITGCQPVPARKPGPCTTLNYKV